MTDDYPKFGEGAMATGYEGSPAPSGAYVRAATATRLMVIVIRCRRGDRPTRTHAGGLEHGARHRRPP